ncbi:unnamed protein product, partial [Musa hybrid cultivar]
MSAFKVSYRLSPLFHDLLFISSRSSPLSLLQSRLFSAHNTRPSSGTFMEVVKAALSHVYATQERAVIRAEQKSYGYAQIVASAVNISNLLHDADVKTVKEGCTASGSAEVVNGSRYLHGARVGIVAKPSAEFVGAILGTWLRGGVAVPLAISYPESELLHVMNDSDVSMILSTPEHQETMENVAAKCSAKVSLIPTVTSMPSNNMFSEHSGEEAIGLVVELIREIEDSCMIKGDDPALILYTSGTTGKPKGVVHTHKSIIAQVQILSEAWEYTNNDQFLHCLPLHHVHGLFNALLAPLYAGSVVEFMPKFSVRGVWQRWRDSYPKDGNKAADAITLFTGVPTMYTRLLQGYQTMDSDLQKACASAANQLRLMMCGSSALPFPVMKQWEEITGHRLLERYGMTEFVMAISNPLHGVRKGGTVGKPLPRVEVKILAEDGSEVGTRGVGELCVRSPSLFKEYWKLPKVTEESFTDDGFFKTGDTVTTDEDGYYVILGRTNADIMKVGGYKLSALEIEAILLEARKSYISQTSIHKAVSECCILGLLDEDYGEIVCAIIAPHADARSSAEQEQKPAITLEDLRSWSKDKLAPYKIPTKLFLWDSLPRNAMGKDYIRLSDGLSSAGALNLKDTELRLGLPGSESPERVDVRCGVDGGLKLRLPKGFVSGTKRAFSDAMDGAELPRNSGGKEEDGDVEAKAAAPWAAKAQVIGWPPIRSYRRNTMASNPWRNKEEETKGSQGGECLYIKVSMDGAPYLRKVDLKTYSTYADLSLALGKMFTCFTLGQCGGTHGMGGREETKTEGGGAMDLLRGSEYVLTYEDKDGDWMLVGDVPWNMFTDSCRRLRIMRGSDAIGMGK